MRLSPISIKITDLHKILCDFLNCNIKSTLFFKKRAICQTIHISLRHGYTDGIRSDAFKILILLSPFPFEIYYINVKGGLNLAKVEIT